MLPNPSRPLTVLALVPVVVLALGACTGGDVSAPATSPPSPTQTAAAEPTAAPSPPSPSPTVRPSPTPTTTGASPTPTPVTLDASCVLEPPDTGDLPAVELRFPSGWEQGDDTVGTCRYFDPEPVDIPEATEALDIDVRWDIEPVAFRRVAQPGPATDERDRLPTTVDGRQAVRIAATSTGEAGLPEGIDTTTWLVDLGVGTGGADGTLVGSTADVADVDYEQAARVLDRMARTVEVGPGEGDAARATVARMEGGGAPFAVTYNPNQGCMALWGGVDQGPRLDESCDLARPEPVGASILRSELHEVAAGLASRAVDVVRLRANTDAQRAVATVPVRGGVRAYALQLSGTEATLVAETFDGRELGRVTVLPE